MRNIKILLLSLILFVSCDNQNTDSSSVRFPIQESISGYAYETPPVIFSKNNNIIVAGNYLIEIEPSSSTIFSVFELPDVNYIGGFGAKGRGPKDFPLVDALTANYEDGDISIYDLQNGFMFINLDDFHENKDYAILNTLKIPLSLSPLNDAILLTDSVICGQPYGGQRDESYVRFNVLSNEVDYFGDYPDLYLTSRKNIFWQIYNRRSVVKPDKTKFASFCSQIKMFRIYNNDGTLGKEVVMETQEDFFEDEWIRINPIKYYGIVQATDDYIYVLCENANDDDLLDNKPTLEIWDWDGNPIASFSLDRSISAFDVTMDNKSIYCTDRTVVDSIYRYDISEILN